MQSARGETGAEGARLALISRVNFHILVEQLKALETSALTEFPEELFLAIATASEVPECNGEGFFFGVSTEIRSALNWALLGTES